MLIHANPLMTAFVSNGKRIMEFKRRRFLSEISDSQYAVGTPHIMQIAVVIKESRMERKNIARLNESAKKLM